MERRPYAIVPLTEGPTAYRVKQYRKRSETLKTIANEVMLETIRQTLLQVANTYDAMANEVASLH